MQKSLIAQHVVVWVTAVIMAGFSAAYVVNTILYLTPPNPIKAQLLPLIYAIEHPYFAQNWHLFAPDPIRTNFTLVIRCRFGNTVTPWHDPYTPLLVAHYRNRFTPMGKVLRVPQNAILALLGRHTDEWRPLLCRRKPDLPACRGDDPPMKALRDLGMFVLQRLSAAACDERAGPGRTTAVQFRILHHTPPPISQRHLSSDTGSTNYLTLPWFPYQPWTGAVHRGDRDATVR